MFKRIRPWFSILCLVIIAWQWGSAARIQAKAVLAQILIKEAWENKLQNPGVFSAPWPWADTEPVARLQWLDAQANIQQDLYVLAGANGRALAFGPGLLDGLGQSLSQVIGGHRDTHFAFLKQTKRGDRFKLQTPDGHWQLYAVSDRHIADSRNAPLWINPTKKSLWLVTCYPFNAIKAGGTLRFVVRADVIAHTVLTKFSEGDSIAL